MSEAIKESEFWSVEKATALLRQKPDVSGSLRSLFGKKNVEDLKELLTDDNLIEADILVATGEMSQPETVQYAKLVPAFAEIAMQEKQWVENVAANFGPSLVQRYKAEKTGGKINLDELIKAIPKLFMSMVKTPGFWVGLFGLNLQLHLLGRLFVEIYNRLPENERRDFVQYCRTLKTKYQVYGGNQEFPGVDFLTEYTITKQLLQTPYILGRLNSVLNETNSEGAKDRDSLHQSLQEKLKKIHRLREYRKVLATTYDLGKMKIGIYRDDFPPSIESGVGTIAQFQLIFRDDIGVKIPVIRTDTRGSTFFQQYPDSNVAYLDMDNAGNITFCNNSSIKLDTILDTDQYLRLQLKVASLIEGYLEAKEDDIPDMFLYATPPARESISTVLHSVAVEATPAEVVISDANTNAMEDHYWTREAVADTLKQAATVHPITPEVKKSNTRIRRRLKCSIVERTLKSMIGPPIRVSGSHHIFKGTNGKVVPIPIHGGDINPHILRHALEQWDISIDEFLDRC